MKNISAFPTSQYASGVAPSGHSEGMSLRDYFAAKALQGLLPARDQTGRTPYSDLPISQCAEMAYELADAMLKARGE